jgi:hypothetical protein
VRACLSIIFLIFLHEACDASAILPKVKLGYLGVKFQDLKYPGDLQKNLKSGLTTTFIIKLNIIGDTDLVKKEINIIVKAVYDLWDEIYRMTVETSSGKRVTNFNTLEKTLAFLTDLEVVHLLELNNFKPIEKIRKWMAQQNVSPSLLTSSPQNSDSAKRAAANVSTAGVANSFAASSTVISGQTHLDNSVFSKIIDEYRNAGASESNWEVTLDSIQYRVADLANEK